MAEAGPAAGDEDVAGREQSAARALDEFRERRRRRRGEDTYFGSVELLLGAEESRIERPEAGHEHRRANLTAEAMAEGMPAELAEMMYDIAREEGIDPWMGFELVRTGLGVMPPEGGVSNAAVAPSTDKYVPGWLLPASPPDDLLRERMLRLSLRRLRHMLEMHADPADALRAFANEPDVGHSGY